MKQSPLHSRSALKISYSVTPRVLIGFSLVWWWGCAPTITTPWERGKALLKETQTLFLDQHLEGAELSRNLTRDTKTDLAEIPKPILQALLTIPSTVKLRSVSITSTKAAVLLASTPPTLMILEGESADTPTSFEVSAEIDVIKFISNNQLLLISEDLNQNQNQLFTLDLQTKQYRQIYTKSTFADYLEVLQAHKTGVCFAEHCSERKLIRCFAPDGAVSEPLTLPATTVVTSSPLGLIFAEESPSRTVIRRWHSLKNDLQTLAAWDSTPVQWLSADDTSTFGVRQSLDWENKSELFILSRNGDIKTIPIPIGISVSSGPVVQGGAVTLRIESLWNQASFVPFSQVEGYLNSLNERAEELSLEAIRMTLPRSKVPVTIIKNRSHPLTPRTFSLISGYGSYGVLHYQPFDPFLIKSVQKGVARILIHIPGGGEFGSLFWNAGRVAGKQLSAEMFHQGVLELFEQGISSHLFTTLVGRSAGAVPVLYATGRKKLEAKNIILESPLLNLTKNVSHNDRPQNKREEVEWGKATSSWMESINPSTYADIPQGTNIFIFATDQDTVTPVTDIKDWMGNNAADQQRRLKAFLFLGDHDAPSTPGDARMMRLLVSLIAEHRW